MAAFDNPHGFTLRGAATDLTCLPYTVTTGETVYIGDVVKVTAAAGTVEQADITDNFVGVSLSYGAAGAEVIVCIDPSALYTVQVENAGTTLAMEDLFEEFDIAASPATPANQTSAQELADAPSTAGQGQFVLLGIEKGPEPNGTILPTWAEASIEAIVRPNVNLMGSVFVTDAAP